MLRDRTFLNKKIATVFHQERFFPAGSYTWHVPAGCTSVDVFLVGGGGGSGNTNPGGGGYTMTFKESSSGWRDGGSVHVTPGQSISIQVGKGGQSKDGEEISGGFGSYSQFMNSNYRAEGGYGGYYTFNNNSQSYRGESGSGGSGGAGWGGLTKPYAGSDGSNGAMGNIVKGGYGQGHTTRDFGESSGKRNAGGGGNDRDSAYGLTQGGASDYSEGSGGDADGLYGYIYGGGGYGGGGSGATGSRGSDEEWDTVGDGGDGTVLIRYYAYA